MTIPTHIKGVIFDMDGLLIDSEPYWEKADAALFKRHGKHHTPAINKYIMGMKPSEIVVYFKKEYGFETEPEALLEERMSLLYEFLLADLTLMPGAKKLIQQLSTDGYRLAIATSGHSQEKASQIAERCGIRDYFSAIVSGDDVAKGKPAPDIFLKAAEAIGIAPEHCLVFEDAPNGVQAGKAAGMIVYGVNHEISIRSRLEESNADTVLTVLANYKQ